MANPARIVEAVLVGALHGSQTNNVLHFGSASLVLDLQQLADALFARMNATLDQAISGEQSFTSIRIRQIHPALLDPIEYFPAAPIHGPDFTPALPSFNAALISFKTGLGGRSHRGRAFFPGVIKNDVEQSVFTNAGLAKWQAWADDLIATFTPQGDPPVVPDFFLGVLSKIQNGQPVAAPGEFTGITVARAASIVATMHSRKKGVGI